LSSSSGAPTGLSEVRGTRTTVGGPNYLGGSVTHAKGDDKIRKMAEAIMDKVVDQLLNEAAEIVLRED
jgi:hypothetical protein